MKKIGFALEAWKLPIFERRLKEAGHAFKTPLKVEGSFDALVMITVWAKEEDIPALYVLGRAALAEARHTRPPTFEGGPLQ